MTRIRRASLLIVLAHPDDEIFHGGVLAHLSERGVRVTLACATDGEAGKPHPSVGPVEDLAALRVEELRLSCARLGIEEPVMLRFHDSARKERQRHDDPHALANVDMLDVEAAIRGIVADVKPHVIVTFEPHGGYYHPDHLAIQRATTAAFFSSGVMGSEAPERLFYGTMLRDVFRVFADVSRGRAPFGVRHHAGDAGESSARRRGDVASVSSGVGARSVPPRRCARSGSTMAVARFLRRVGNSRTPHDGGCESRSGRVSR
jgi:N-acetyl-1-D-myo-inositol-2-amino-2-deoxy-alpha-D-glucopyranoside deacetylase